MPGSPESLAMSLDFFQHIKLRHVGVMQPDVLCGCETWSLTWKGRRLSVFDNWVLKEYSGGQRVLGDGNIAS